MGWMGWCCQRTQWSVPATCVSLCVCVLVVYCCVCRNDLRFVCQLKKQTAATGKTLARHCTYAALPQTGTKKGTTATAQVLTDVRCQRGVGLTGGVATKATVLAVCVSRERERERGVGAEMLLIESQRRIQRGPGNT